MTYTKHAIRARYILFIFSCVLTSSFLLHGFYAISVNYTVISNEKLAKIEKFVDEFEAINQSLKGLK